MDFDLNNIARELNEAWNTEGRTIEANGVKAQVLIVRNGETKHIVDLKAYIDNWRTAPESIKGVARMQSPESFIDLVKRHNDPGASVLFVDTMSAQPSIQAVVDYHDINGNPSFMRHRVSYAFPLAKEWLFWNGVDGKAQGQGDFAFLIEDRIADLVTASKVENDLAAQMGTKTASPAEMLTLSKGLQVRVDQTMKEVLDIGTGEASIVYEENHKGENGKPLKVPGLFTIQIPVFHGDAPVRVPVRLRYRKVEQKVVWFMALYRPDLVLLDKVKAVAIQARDDTGLPLFFGSPEA